MLANFLAVELGWIANASEGGQLFSGIVGDVILLIISHFIVARSQPTA